MYISFWGQKESLSISMHPDSIYYHEYSLSNQAYITSSTLGYEIRLQNTTYSNNAISLVFSGYGDSGSKEGKGAYALVSYVQIIPKKILINDSLDATLGGIYCSGMRGFDLLNKNYDLDLVIFLGLEFGRLRLYGNSLLRKKNGYFAPKIEIQPKIKLKRLVIGGAIGYGYDISNSNWKDTWFSKDKSYSLNKLRQSGFSWQVFLGWSMYK